MCIKWGYWLTLLFDWCTWIIAVDLCVVKFCQCKTESVCHTSTWHMLSLPLSLPVCWQCVTNAATCSFTAAAIRNRKGGVAAQLSRASAQVGQWWVVHNFHKKLCGFMLALLLNFNFWRCKIRTLKGKLIIVTLSDHHINLISTVYLLALKINSVSRRILREPRVVTKLCCCPTLWHSP